MRPVRVLLADVVDRALQLRLGLVGIVGLEDAPLRFHHLGKRPVADALAVRQRPALPPEDQLRILLAALQRSEQLRDESALADAGNADERDELERALLPCAGERPLERLELSVASDERRPCLRRDVDAEPRVRLQRL